MINNNSNSLSIIRETINIRKKRNLKSMIRMELARFKIPADILIQSEDETLEYKNIALEIRDIVERKIDNILNTNV